MKYRKLFLLLLTFIFTASLFAQTINQRVTDEDGKEKLLGQANREGLTSAPFGQWFSQEYKSYKVNKGKARWLKPALKDYEITLFLGTWCGDSRREVPRFLKILDKAKYPENQLKVICLDNEAQTYKQSPTGEEKGLNIHRVPTFILYRHGKEVGRIVESPVGNLESDLQQILAGHDYEPNYKVVTQINQLLETKGLDHLRQKATILEGEFKQQVENIDELNTYGYVLLFAGNNAAAIEVFKINCKLFVEEERAYFSLGRGYELNGQKEKALINYEKALAINPDNKRVKELIKDMIR